MTDIINMKVNQISGMDDGKILFKKHTITSRVNKIFAEIMIFYLEFKLERYYVFLYTIRFYINENSLILKKNCRYSLCIRTRVLRLKIKNKMSYLTTIIIFYSSLQKKQEKLKRFYENNDA